MQDKSILREFQRFSINFSIYNNYLDYDDKNLIGYTNDVSSGGIGFFMNYTYDPPAELIFKFFPHPKKDTKFLELKGELKWTKKGLYFHDCGYQFIGLTEEDKESLSTLIQKRDSIANKIYLQPSQSNSLYSYNNLFEQSQNDKIQSINSIHRLAM